VPRHHAEGVRERPYIPPEPRDRRVAERHAKER
jgi:hypothetical protein